VSRNEDFQKFIKKNEYLQSTEHCLIKLKSNTQDHLDKQKNRIEKDIPRLTRELISRIDTLLT